MYPTIIAIFTNTLHSKENNGIAIIIVGTALTIITVANEFMFLISMYSNISLIMLLPSVREIVQKATTIGTIKKLAM